MDVKEEILLQLFNKSKLRNETKKFLEPELFSIQGWESILKKVKNKSIFDKSPKSKEKVDFDDT